MGDKNKRAKNSRVGMFERINRRLDIDCDMLCRGFCAELRGKNHAEICGVRRIFTYTDTQISFVTADGIFSVRGQRLCCVSYKRGAIIVEGNIVGMSFEQEENNGTC